MIGRFYISAPGADVDNRLTFGHQLANSFPTKAEAHRVATEVLREASYSVWYQTPGKGVRRVALVGTGLAS